MTEEDNPGQDPTDLHSIGRPVELTLLAWWSLESLGHLAIRETIFKLLEEAVEGRLGALIALLADLLHDPTTYKLLLDEPGVDLISEGLKLRIDFWRSLVFWWAMSHYGSFDCIAGDTKLSGDPASAPILGIETSDSNPHLHRNHLLPPVLRV